MMLRFALVACSVVQFACVHMMPIDNESYTHIDDCDDVDIVQELPDDNATLSVDVDIYVVSKDHKQWRTYTLPVVESLQTIKISKTTGHCDIEDSISVIDSHGHVMFDIATEYASHGCRGWATVMTVGDEFDWALIEFGGDVSW